MRISLVIPLYNKHATIQRALQSVFTQTVQPEEIIVVNDGSTDGSDKVVEAINHPLINLIHQPNSGVSAARNFGVKEAKGDWIAFLDADDELLPDFFKSIKELRNNYSDASIFATAYYLQDHNGFKRPLNLKKLPFTGQSGLLTNYFEVASCSEPPICSSAVVINKTALNAIVGFPYGIESGEDLLTWAKLAVNNKIAYSLSPLSIFIQDPGHTYNDIPNRVPQMPDLVGKELALLAHQFNNVACLKSYVGHWHKMRASIFLRLGKKKEALKEVMKSLSFKALNYRVYAYVFFLFLPLSLVNRIFKIHGKA